MPPDVPEDQEERRAKVEQELHTMPETQGEVELPYTLFGPRETIVIVIIASLAALFSPLSANIYYPALNILASDLNVSLSLINLTITSYLVWKPR